MAENYELKSAAAKRIDAPSLPYRPRRPVRYRPKLGLIGCGGIANHHLAAARAMGVEVVALADHRRENAARRRDEFFPSADIHTDHRQVLARDDIEVVDIATHPEKRAALIAEALRAGKHVLSQKPFALSLDEARRLADLADACGRRLAVNQNGRWAPCFSYLREAVRSGLLGEIHTLDLAVQWDHTWCRDTPFENVPHLVLADFGIHWFDIAACVFAGRPAEQVFAQVARAPGQTMRPPMLAHAGIRFEHGLATLSFSAHTAAGPLESMTAVGAKGTLRGSGPVCGIRELSLHTAAGVASVPLEGAWFPDGFAGALGELLCAIEEDREPVHSARNNLATLALGFAALRSADQGLPVQPECIQSTRHPS